MIFTNRDREACGSVILSRSPVILSEAKDRMLQAADERNERCIVRPVILSEAKDDTLACSSRHVPILVIKNLDGLHFPAFNVPIHTHHGAGVGHWIDPSAH